MIVAIDDGGSFWNIINYTANIYSSFSSYCLYFACILLMGSEQSRSSGSGSKLQQLNRLESKYNKMDKRSNHSQKVRDKIMFLRSYISASSPEKNNNSHEHSESRTRSSHGTRKWSRDAPKSVGDRSAVLSKCGRQCFLGPGKTFPICARLGSGSGSGTGTCKIDPRGVAAADSRAREWAAITARKKRTASGARAHRRYTAVARRAKAILSKLHPR